MRTEKQCIKCGVVKPLDEFYKNANCTDGHFNKCKECTRAYNRAYKRKERGYEGRKKAYAPRAQTGRKLVDQIESLASSYDFWNSLLLKRVRNASL